MIPRYRKIYVSATFRRFLMYLRFLLLAFLTLCCNEFPLFSTNVVNICLFQGGTFYIFLSILAPVAIYCTLDYLLPTRYPTLLVVIPLRPMTFPGYFVVKISDPLHTHSDLNPLSEEFPLSTPHLYIYAYKHRHTLSPFLSFFFSRLFLTFLFHAWNYMREK